MNVRTVKFAPSVYFTQVEILAPVMLDMATTKKTTHVNSAMKTARRVQGKVSTLDYLVRKVSCCSPNHITV